MRAHAIALTALAIGSAPLPGQITMHPDVVEPAAWERFALRVVNQRPAALVGVRLEVPDAVTILGTQAPPGWGFTVSAATDTTPQVVEWRGGSLGAGAFEEFAFLGRVIGDARRRELVFPLTLERADGSRLRWGADPGDPPPPRVMIRGSTFITSWGAAALGGAALGLSALALAIVGFRRRDADAEARSGASGGGSDPGS